MSKKPAEEPTNPAVVAIGVVPPLQVSLAIARRGVAEPGKLTDREVRDLSRTLLVHYAQMGIR